MKQQFSFHNVFWGVVIGMASIYFYSNVNQALYPESSVLGTKTTALAPMYGPLPPVYAPEKPSASNFVPCSAAKEFVGRYCGTMLPPGNTLPNYPTPMPTKGPYPTSMVPSPTLAKGIVFTMSPQSTFTPNGKAYGSAMVTKLTTDFYSYTVSLTASSLQPNRQYQVWLCGAGASCSSNGQTAVFKTDATGNGRLSGVVLTNNQTTNPLRYVKLWQPFNTGDNSNDTSACYMTGGNSTPCLQGIFSM